MLTFLGYSLAAFAVGLTVGAHQLARAPVPADPAAARRRLVALRACVVAGIVAGFGVLFVAGEIAAERERAARAVEDAIDRREGR